MSDHQYSAEDIAAINAHYKSSDVRTWPFFPIAMPLKEGQGPASDEECDEITWEVWDCLCETYGSFKSLPDAINLSLTMTSALLFPPELDATRDEGGA